MEITLVSPFRIPFELPRDQIMANHDQWIERIQYLQNSPSDLKRPNVIFGNYAWSKLKDLRDESGRVYGSDEGINDAGWFFNSHYFMQLDAKFDLTETSFFNHPGYNRLFDSNAEWNCRIIDNTIALMTVTITIKNLSQFSEGLLREVAHEESDISGSQQYYDATNTLCDDLIIKNKSVINNAIEWVKSALFQPLKFNNSECNEQFLNENPPLYRKTYRSIFWTHRAYKLKDETRLALNEISKSALLMLISNSMGENWLKNGGFAYGWGATIAVENDDYGRQWLDALIVSQYYYACLDLADTTLPISISTLRMQSNSGKRTYVLSYTRKMHAKINTIINDYRDIRSRVSSEAANGVLSYYKNWRMEELEFSVKGKLQEYKELILTTSDTVNQKFQSYIEIFLFALSLLSIVGLSMSLHNYLSAGFDPRQQDSISEIASHLSKIEVIGSALLVIVFLLLVYIVHKFKR